MSRLPRAPKPKRIHPLPVIRSYIDEATGKEVKVYPLRRYSYYMNAADFGIAEKDVPALERISKLFN